MNFLDDLRGVLLILGIVLLAGGISYVGDRVGHQVGRKRLTLFNIRPRYTSTIVAVATGMLIALAVVTVALLASRDVQTAFFKLASVNREISTLQQRERELGKKVNTGRLVVGVDSLMTDFYATIPQGSNVARRKEIMRAFFDDTVKFVNQTYVPFGLKPARVPKGTYARLNATASSPQLGFLNDRANVLLIAVAHRNLFVNDRIDLSLDSVPDTLIYPAKTQIVEFKIDAGRNVNVNLSIRQLSNAVAQVLQNRGLASALVANITPVSVYPSLSRMQEMLKSGKGSYLLVAWAATDIYPHTYLQEGRIPIVVTLLQPGGSSVP